MTSSNGFESGQEVVEIARRMVTAVEVTMQREYLAIDRCCTEEMCIQPLDVSEIDQI